MSTSYGHAYLTSYGWTGTGTGLRKGAIDRPLAIPPKKNLSGIGKDHDEAFPFWDHLFTAASKAITIRISSDDEDEDVDEDVDEDGARSHTDPLRRTATGILSNRRPTSGTPVDADPHARPSLLAVAKREAAKRSLYAGFFRGPVLGPDREDDPPSDDPSSSSLTPPVQEEPDNQDAAGETRQRGSKKRKSEDGEETREERRERRRLKKERKAARAARKAEKALLAKESKELPRQSRSQDPRKSLTGNDPTQDASDTSSIVLTTKKKRKQKDTLP